MTIGGNIASVAATLELADETLNLFIVHRTLNGSTDSFFSISLRPLSTEVREIFRQTKRHVRKSMIPYRKDEFLYTVLLILTLTVISVNWSTIEQPLS